LGETEEGSHDRISAVVEALGEGASLVLLERTLDPQLGVVLATGPRKENRSGAFFRLAEAALPQGALERLLATKSQGEEGHERPLGVALERIVARATSRRRGDRTLARPTTLSDLGATDVEQALRRRR
jgi:hypothetical protein